MKIPLLLSITLLFSIHTLAEVSEGVFSELAKFKSNTGEALPANYIQKLPEFILNIMQDSEKKFLSHHENICSDSVDIQYINQFENNGTKEVMEFESGFIKIDVSKCFENSTPTQLMQITSSPEFKKKAISTIKASTFDGTTYCEKTSAAFVGDSFYCYKISLDAANDHYLKSTSFNSWNDSDPKYNVKVFFRAGYVTARQIQNHTLYHLITYIRGPKLSSFQKIFAKSFIAKAQEETFIKLKEELK